MMDSEQLLTNSCASTVAGTTEALPMERSRSRLDATASSADSANRRLGGGAETSTSSTGAVDATGRTTASAARRHGAAGQIALQRQMKVFEDRVTLGTPWASAPGGLPAGSGPAAAQAALAAALEACVERVAQSEAWLASVDMEVRQLRVESESSSRAIDSLAVGLEGRFSMCLEVPTSRDGGARLRTGSTSPPPGDLRASNWLMQRVERLETEVRHLTFKFDAGDEEFEQLKMSRAELVTRRELVDVTQTLRGDVNGLRENLGDVILRCADFVTQQQLADTAKPLQRELQLIGSRTAHSEGQELRAELSVTMRQQLAGAVEPLMLRLEQLGEFAAHGEKAGRDAAQARKDVENLRGDLMMVKAVGKEGGNETKSDSTISERLFRSLKIEFTSAIAELSDSSQLMKMELKCLSEKVQVTHPMAQHGVEAVAQLIRDEVKNISRGATRQELQEATKLLLEVKDAGKSLKDDIVKSAEEPVEPVITRREFSSVMESWRRELGALAMQLSEQIAMLEKTEAPPAISESKNMVTRQELAEIIDLLRQEVEMLTKRVQRGESAVSRHEFAETVKLLKQELLVVANKAAHGDLVSRHQELLDVAALMKHEVRSFSEKGAITKQDLASALEALRQEVSQGIQRSGPRTVQELPWLELEPLLVRQFESLWRDRFSVGLRIDVLRELEHDMTTSKRDCEDMNKYIHKLEDTLKTRCASDISQLSDNVRRDISELSERFKRIEFGSGSASEFGQFEQRQDNEQTAVEVVRRDISGLSERFKKIELGSASAPEFAQLLSTVEQRRDNEQNALEVVLERISTICDRVCVVESSVVAVGELPQGVIARLNRLEHDLETSLRSRTGPVDVPAVANAASGTNLQLPMLQLGAMNSQSSGGDHAQHLEKIVDALRKRIDVLSDSLGKNATPRGIVGEGVAQLMAGVRKDQEQERVVVEALLARIGSLCDRIVAVERKVGAAIESGEAASTGATTELAATLEAHVEEAKTDSKSVTLRLDALEGTDLAAALRAHVEAAKADSQSVTLRLTALEGAPKATGGRKTGGWKTLQNLPAGEIRKRCTVQEFLGPDFSPNSPP